MFIQNRREFLRTMALSTAAMPFLTCGNSSRRSDRLPNIVFIMADDVGLEVLGCYGGTSYHTPNLDRLAETGVKFTHCYSAPVCSPSRVKIMTGRYIFRTTEEWGTIPPDEKTFGHVLKSAGYATALAGKWQMTLLKNDPLHVRKMGFHENCCFGWHEGPRYYNPLIWQNGEIRKDVKDRYGPDVFCDFIIDFMRQNKENTFLAYYPMALAHEISNDLKTPPPPGPDGRYQTYKELIEIMDKKVGRIIQTLDGLGLRENTLILFTGDNGTPKHFITKVENGKYIRTPLFSFLNGKKVQGGKGELTDAGTHVPLIANWPGRVPSDSVCDDLIDFSDFLPTLTELTRADLPADVIIDGRSFAPQLLGRTGNPREWVYTQWEGKHWIRTKRWKLYHNQMLYDMIHDPFEKTPFTRKSDTPESSKAREKLNNWLSNLLKKPEELT